MHVSIRHAEQLQMEQAACTGSLSCSVVCPHPMLISWFMSMGHAMGLHESQRPFVQHILLVSYHLSTPAPLALWITRRLSSRFHKSLCFAYPILKATLLFHSTWTAHGPGPRQPLRQV